MNSSARVENGGWHEKAMPALMNALVYQGAGRCSWDVRRRPAILEATDAIVRITTSAICEADLHILRGDVPTVTSGRVLGHEGIGIVEQIGDAVSEIKVGDKVLISSITSCAACAFCRSGMPSHCVAGGWILGHTIDGTQAEYVRIPHARTSLYPIPAEADEAALVLLSDVFPTGFECGVLSGQVEPGDVLAIVGAGPIGLAALLTAQLYSPAEIVMVDQDATRLEAARGLGATHVVDSSKGGAAEAVLALTGGFGVQVAIEAAGLPEAFDICQGIVAPGGHIAVVGVHGKPVQLHLERLWSHNVSITTRLVDTVTTPRLLKLALSGRIEPGKLVTHRFPLGETVHAYAVFTDAAAERALKVILVADAGNGRAK